MVVRPPAVRVLVESAAAECVDELLFLGSIGKGYAVAQLEQTSHIGGLGGDELPVCCVLCQEIIKDVSIVQILRNGDAQQFFGILCLFSAESR